MSESLSSVSHDKLNPAAQLTADLDINSILNALRAAMSDEQSACVAKQSKSFQAFLTYLFAHSDFVTRVSQQYPKLMAEKLIQVYAQSDYVDTASPTNTPALRTLASGMIENPKTLAQRLLEFTADYQNRYSRTDEMQFSTLLRQFRQVEMAQIACLDILHLHNITQSMTLVSELAQAIIEQAYAYIYESLAARYGKPEGHQHLQIMAMGKLGGGELNFSSDIDLIFAYPEQGTTKNQNTNTKRELEHQSFFTKLAQKLIQALDNITQDGRCYRVDMRLRPLGESGPLVMPFAAFESYYQEQGRAWERFAMQKMRIINPNKWSNELYGLVHPFVYRRYIDYTTIDAIREMKRLIEKEVKRRQLSNNIKLGAGGIREVEFFVQSFQLIHAGRLPECQQVSTLKALDALANAGLVEADTIEQLRNDYLFLRRIEQYLQLFQDEQTQTLPQDEKNQLRLASLLGHSAFEESHKLIESCMKRINKVFKTVTDDANEVQKDEEPISEHHKDDFDDMWSLDLNKVEFLALCHSITRQGAKQGADDAEDLDENALNHIFLCLQNYKQKLKKSGLSERGMRSINRLLPLILQELLQNILVSSTSSNNEQDSQQISDTNTRFDTKQLDAVFSILQAITTRVTYVDLLLENPDVRHRLYHLSAKSVWVAEQIAIHPILLDELLHPVYLQPDQASLENYHTHCADELRQSMLRVDPDDIEALMDTLRQFKHAFQLRIAAADISGTIAINQVSDKLTILAQVILQEVINQAWRLVCHRHGVPEGQSSANKGFAVVAYGKFGGIELSYGSDLDIVCLYNADASGMSDDSGSKQAISHQEFYIKLVQRISHFCITKTYQGVLYDIDLRLRPSGNSGLLISHIDSFAEYQCNKAWTWEHQALVRSRMAIGDAALISSFNDIRSKTLGRQRELSKLKHDIRQMREKMRKHLDKSNADYIDIKQCKGGIVDIEFLVQFWVLAYAQKHPALYTYSDNLRIIEACIKAEIIDKAMGETLSQHYLWLRHLTHRLQLADRKLARPSTELFNINAQVHESFSAHLLDES